MRKILKNLLVFVFVLLFWLFAWQIAAFAVSKPELDKNFFAIIADFFTSRGNILLLPGPIPVIERWFEMSFTSQFWRAALTSLLRVALGALSAVIAGTLLSVLSFKFKTVSRLLTPFISVIKSTPVSSFIILALLWIGRDSVPSWIAALIVLPAVYENLISGFGSADPQLLEMAKVFGISKIQIVRRIYVSAAKPYFLSACRLSLGLAWKAGIAAEVLSIPKYAIGKHLYESKLYLETVDLFAWTLTVILLSLLIEKLFVMAFGKRGREAEK